MNLPLEGMLYNSLFVLLQYCLLLSFTGPKVSQHFAGVPLYCVRINSNLRVLGRTFRKAFRVRIQYRPNETVHRP